MSLKCLSIVLLATLAVAEIPPYFKVCGRKDPNLEKCVVSAVEALREKLRTGIPELDAPPVEPLHLDEIALIQSDALTAFARNINFTGLSNFEVKNFKIDFENKRFNVVVYFKRLFLDAEYDVNAKIVLPIVRRGPIHITTDDVRADVILQYKLIKKNGAESMFFTSMNTKLAIKDYKAEFDPSEGPNNPLSMAIREAVHGGRKEILEAITPVIENVIPGVVLKFANNICTHFTFDELFPDRE